MSGAPRWPKRAFRIVSLVVPSALAGYAAPSAPRGDALSEIVTCVLAPLWLGMGGVVALCAVGALRRRRGARSFFATIDVLTASGCATAWAGAAAIVGSVSLGWASLSVVGILGLGLVHLVASYTLVVASGREPCGGGVLSRRIVPEGPVAGEDVTEELRLRGPRIPTGFRLFLAGRLGDRWPVSRYAVDGADGGGEIVLRSDLGPAPRGDWKPEPMEAWLGDVFGLCRTARTPVGACGPIVVRPRPRVLQGAFRLLGARGMDREARATRRLPTEGSLQVRDYRPGDDARRIHWVRSLEGPNVIVRLPDEVPDDPHAVRVVLDTFLPGADDRAWDGADVLLDRLVEVWLAVGRALLARGTRVSLVTAAPGSRGLAPCAQGLTQRNGSEALLLAAKVGWQMQIGLSDLLQRDVPSVVVSCRAQPDPADRAPSRWVLVPQAAWALAPDASVASSAVGRFSFPTGSIENRRSSRRRARDRLATVRRDIATLLVLCADRAPRAGCLVAHVTASGSVCLEVAS